jgi:DNA polymerase I-like protein with 3'-5' exonuclease and polymerase domains
MRRKLNIERSNGLQPGLFMPRLDWEPAKDFPNLSSEKMLGIDIESRDPDLTTRGPGFLRGTASVVGVSIATIDRSWYFPIGHLGGGNLDRAAVTAFVRDQVHDKNRFVCGANLQYELEGLDVGLGINVGSKVIDVQIAEALIDEESETTALEALCKKYIGPGKDELILRKAGAECGLVDVKGNLWKLHSKYVGPYAEYDAQCVLHIFREQLKTLKKEELESIFTLECKLLPLLWQMRKRGIRMDVEKAHDLSKSLETREKELRFAINQKYGTQVDEWSGPMLAMACDRLGIKYPRTAIGNPSFTADFIEGTVHPFLDDVSDLRELNKLRKTFVDKWILDNLVGEFIHPQWRQIATDEGGTRTGRMAAANPNPQQVPAGKYRKTGKPNDIGAMIRSCFIPHRDGLQWAKFDYSEQEPRILTHFAALCNCTGAREVAAKYRASRDFKIYPFMMEIAGLDKRPAKDCYLGRCYGMGIKKLAMKFNKSEDEAKQILKKFDDGVPFVKEIADMTMSIAQRRGYIKTFLGRRRHFNFWEPVEAFKMRHAGMDTTPVRLDVAKQKWLGLRLQRANTHKALNSLIQGTAADMTKAAMIDCWEEHRMLPYMQVHDELNFGTTPDQDKSLQDTIENCLKMEVPILSNPTIGAHWK